MQVCLFVNGHVTISSQLCLEITGCLWPQVKQASEGSDADLLPHIPYPVESSVVCVGDDMQSLHAVCRTTSADHDHSFLLFQWTNGKRLQADFVNWKHVCVMYANFRQWHIKPLALSWHGRTMFLMVHERPLLGMHNICIFVFVPEYEQTVRYWSNIH